MLSSIVSNCLQKKLVSLTTKSTGLIMASAKARLSTAPLKSSPSYTVFGEKAMLNVKIIPPVFRMLRTGILVMDGNRKGRLLLEWCPRADGGGINRDLQIRFGLSPEEVGFLLDQLPHNEVEFSRRLPASVDQPGQVADEIPEKVFRVVPGEGGQFAFRVDFEKNGIGGQTVSGEDTAMGPLEVVAQLGEYRVMRELMQRSIPALTGWETQMNVAMQNAVHAALTGNGNMYGAGGGGGGEAVPF